MFFRQLYDTESSTYTYLLADKDTGEAIMIDPVIEQVERDVTLLNELGLKLLYVIDTHVHADHVTGAGALRQRTGCKTAVSALAGVNCADIMLKQGDWIRFGKHEIEVLMTPGHTDTCMSLRAPGMVFTGDALLIRGCGRVDFQSGNAARLYDSIVTKLFVLPDETLIYPAHDYHGMTVSTVGEEKKYNPRLKLGRDGFIKFMHNLRLPLPKRIQEALPANQSCGKRESAA